MRTPVRQMEASSGKDCDASLEICPDLYTEDPCASSQILATSYVEDSLFSFRQPQMAVITRSQAREEANARRRNIFRLPREIRRVIYQYVLAPRGAVMWDPRGNTFPGDAFPLNANDVVTLMGTIPAYMGLLKTCKQIHYEVASLLYNTVEMDLRDDREPEKAALTLGLRHLRHIKHITIEFRHYARSMRTWQETNIGTLGSWRTAAILRLLQRAGATLHTVTLKAPWHHTNCPGRGRPVHMGCISLQPLLRDASIFSNVQTVIFPEYVSLCPSRNTFHGTPQRNRPLNEAQKEEITKRLCFQAEGATDYVAFQRSAAFLPKGFFVVKNPGVSFGSENILLPPCEGEWKELVQEHLAQLKSYGLSDYRINRSH